MRELIFEFNLAPSQSASNLEGAEEGPSVDPGLMAMTYDLKVRWVTEKLGPKSRHWKRLVWEVKPKTV